MREKKKLDAIWQYYSAVTASYIVLAILSARLIGEASFQISTGYLTSNPLLSTANTYFAPATHVSWTIEYRWALALLMALSIIVPAIYIYMIKNNVKKINFHKYRFIDWTVTGSFIIILIALLSGISDIATLLLITGLSVIGCILFNTLITNKVPTRNIVKPVYSSAVIATVLPWLMIAIYAIGSWVYGGIRTPWYVYGVYIVGLVSSAVVIYAYSWHKNPNLDEKRVEVETYPILINGLIKVAFVLILIIGLKR